MVDIKRFLSKKNVLIRFLCINVKFVDIFIILKLETHTDCESKLPINLIVIHLSTFILHRYYTGIIDF